jgi:antibiotic biosynthesis monooxygenase (ABM) superfamily enzyme
MTSSRTGTAAERAVGALATVVVSQRVRPDRVEDFHQWQDGMNRTVASFPGFLGTEVVPPAEASDDWTVLYRFRSKRLLERWLSSTERAEMLGRGEGLFERPASQHVLIGKRTELVTVVVAHPVGPDRVDEFLAWQRRVVDAEETFPGFGGSELLPPVPGVQEDWTTVFSFDTEDNLNSWLGSPQRKKLLDEGQGFEQFELHRISSPFGSWFSPLGRGDVAGPPRWKTALSVLVGLYPTVVLLSLGISEIWRHGKLWETLLLGNVLSVTLLTWVVMPIVTRALAFWLEPDPDRAGGRLDAIGAALSVAFLTLAALVFWLVTTQIWTLP